MSLGVITMPGLGSGLAKLGQAAKAAQLACVTAFAAWANSAAQTYENTDVQTQNNDTNIVVFYRGVTYYDGLRAQDEGFNSGDVLGRRQQGREMSPGFYTSRNIEVAKYFAGFNSHPYLGSPGQGGPALMTIAISQKRFQELATKYAIIDNRHVGGLPGDVAQPHVETVFPYNSLAELYTSALVSVEPLP